MPDSFFDTNVLLYLASGEATKADRTEAILSKGGAISVQVLNEAANVARRKMGMSWREAQEFLKMLRGILSVHPVTIETHDTGLALAERYKLSVYDATIASAALIAGCHSVWSEDMQHGFSVEGRLRIVNPFRTAQ